MVTRAKYRNIKTCVDGEKFDSIAECRRYQVLLLLQKAGEIKDLKRQVVFELAPRVVIQGRTKPALRYVADFQYVHVGSNCTVTEDVKGMLTPVYKIKRHLMKTVHGVEILETK